MSICNAAYDDSFANIKTRNHNAVGVPTEDRRLHALQLATSNNPKVAICLKCRLGQYKGVLISWAFYDEIREHTGFKQFAAFAGRLQLSSGKRDIDLGKSAAWIKLCADAIDERFKLNAADENEHGAVSDGRQLH